MNDRSDRHPDPVIERYLRDPELQGALDQLEAHNREALTPLDHERRKYGRSDADREPARRVRLSEATPDDFAAAHRGEAILIPDPEGGASDDDD